jgi:REP element-mobilizing transposase RayT
MGKLVRYQQCDCFHFVTFSCHRRRPLSGSATAYGLFERELEAVRKRYGFVVSGYVLMPEHVRDPVVRGLAAKPEDWSWSSFRHYATGEIGAVEIESQSTAFRRGNQLPEHLRFAEKSS